MSGSHMWVKQTLPTTVFVPSWFISGRLGMLFLPCSPGRRLFSCVLLILTPAHTHLRLIIADGSWQYLRPCWRSVPHWIVVLTSVSVAWLAFVLPCVPIYLYRLPWTWPEWEWVTVLDWTVCVSCSGLYKEMLDVCFPRPSLGIPRTLSLCMYKYFTGVVCKSPFDCTVQSLVIEPCFSNSDM